MATGNILEARINVSAPGAKEAFESVAKSANAVNNALSDLGAQGSLSLKSIQDALVKLKVILSQSTDPAEIQKLNIAISALQNKAKDLAPAFEKVHVSSLRASSSALNLSHSLGLIPAEASHLTHGIESIIFSFEQMQAKTGSTAGALKGLASVIGQGLAIGLAITALDFLIKKLFDTEDATKISKEELERFSEALKDVKDNTKDLSDELQFLNQISAINIKINGLTDLLDLQGQSVSQQQFTQDLLDKREKVLAIGREITNDEKLNGEDLIKAKKENEQALGDIDKQIADSRKKQRLIYRNIQLQRNDDQKDADEKNLKAYRDYLKKLQELQDFEDGLFKGLAEAVKAIHATLLKSIVIDQKVRANIILDINTDNLATDFDKEQKIGSQLQKRIESLTENNPILIKAKAKVELTAEEKELQAAADSISEQITNVMADAFSGIGNALGEALAGGDIGSALQAFASTLGAGVKAIGEQLIALGTAALAVKLATKGLFKNPALEIAAGIALVAVGTALQKVLAGGVKGFAAGGFTGSGRRDEPAGIVHRGEFVVPAFAVNRLGIGFLNNLAFGSNIRGYESGGLVGSPVNVGGVTVRIEGQFFQRGSDMVATIAATNRSQKNNF